MFSQESNISTVTLHKSSNIYMYQYVDVLVLNVLINDT